MPRVIHAPLRVQSTSPLPETLLSSLLLSLIVFLPFLFCLFYFSDDIHGLCGFLRTANRIGRARSRSSSCTRLSASPETLLSSLLLSLILFSFFSSLLSLLFRPHCYCFLDTVDICRLDVISIIHIDLMVYGRYRCGIDRVTCFVSCQGQH